MISLVPLAFFIVIFLLFRNSHATRSWRTAFMSASLVWGLVATAITESLSLFRLVVPWAVLGLWAMSAVLATICLIRAVHSGQRPPERPTLAGMSRFEILLLVGLALIFASVGIVAWISPPHNFDSMTYHMSRVVHWIQNKSVADYPTNIPRQLHQNPWAEYAILQFQILSGGDRLANLIQWFSMIGVALGVSLVAKQLGCSLRGQICAAVIGATIPMAILQGSTTQNDYVVSFWLVCFAYYAILLKEHGHPLYSWATGGSLGLAILTKATAYIYAFPFIVWIGLSLIKSRHTNGLRLILLSMAIALSINLGHYARNFALYRSPLGPGQEGEAFTYANDISTISSVTSNVIRNIGLHVGTPFSTVNAILENGIYRLHGLLGIAPNDVRTTWAGTEFHVLFYPNSEDYAGNPLHLALITVSIPILMLQRRMQKDAGYYSVCLLVGFVLFCLYLKWQPWHSRLHLPLFILWSPPIGLWLSQVRARNTANLVVAIMIFGAVPMVVHNLRQSVVHEDGIAIIDRVEQYFTNRPSLYEPYIGSVRFLRNAQCWDIGLLTGGDDWEYPFWVMLREGTGRKIRLEHVNVANISKVKYDEYPFNTFTPCAVIVVSPDPPNEVHIGDVTYLRKWSSIPVTVFVRD